MTFLPELTTVMGVVMSFGYFTQAFRIIKTKSSKDVSLSTYLIFGIGVAVWLAYGLSIRNYPIIISNIVALIGALSVITVHFLNKH